MLTANIWLRLRKKAEKLKETSGVTAFSVAGLAVVVALVGARPAVAQLSAAEPSPKKAEEVYDNIQVLKGLPYAQLIPTMQLMSETLGVGCEFCHEADNRALEGNPRKEIARSMMEMVFAINENTFGGRRAVTCYTCHRGSPRAADMPDWPQVFANQELMQEPSAGKISGETNRSALPSVDQVLDKYVNALGGKATLQKISTRVEKGTASITRQDQPPSQLPVETYAKVPDRRFTKGFSVSHLGNSAGAFGVYHGAAGWMREGSGPVRVMFGWRRDAARLEDTLNLPLRVKQLVRDLHVEGTGKAGDTEAYIVSGRTEYLPRVELYFEQRSGLLTRLVYFAETVVGSFPTQIDYADYRSVDGQMVPFRRSVTLIRGVRVTYQMEEVQQNIPVEESEFAIPTPLPSLYR